MILPQTSVKLYYVSCVSGTSEMKEGGLGQSLGWRGKIRRLGIPGGKTGSGG